MVCRGNCKVACLSAGGTSETRVSFDPGLDTSHTSRPRPLQPSQEADRARVRIRRKASRGVQERARSRRARRTALADDGQATRNRWNTEA